MARKKTEQEKPAETATAPVASSFTSTTGYDVEMIQDFLRQLLAELEYEANPDAFRAERSDHAEEAWPLVKKRGVSLLKDVSIVRGISWIQDEIIDKYRNSYVQMRRRELTALRALSELLQEAAECARHPLSAGKLKVEHRAIEYERNETNPFEDRCHAHELPDGQADAEDHGEVNFIAKAWPKLPHYVQRAIRILVEGKSE